jgi:hypothetical protein
MGIRASFEVPGEALMALVLDDPSGDSLDDSPGGAGAVPSGTIEYAAPFGV